MWLPADRDAAVAWQQEQARLCSGCGNPKRETYDPVNEFAYEAVVLQCHACATRDRKLDKYEERFGLYASAHKRRR